ncbi:MAG: hypothetical protein KBF68_08945 [Nitrosomonas sp.]|nr:hypothetical protein [Nitrosomonas sp.]
MKNNKAIVKNLRIGIEAPNKKIELFDSRDKATYGDLMVGNFDDENGEVTFAIATDNNVVIALQVSQEAALVIADIIVNAALDGETKQ